MIMAWSQGTLHIPCQCLMWDPNTMYWSLGSFKSFYPNPMPPCLNMCIDSAMTSITAPNNLGGFCCNPQIRQPWVILSQPPNHLVLGLKQHSVICCQSPRPKGHITRCCISTYENIKLKITKGQMFNLKLPTQIFKINIS